MIQSLEATDEGYACPSWRFRCICCERTNVTGYSDEGVATTSAKLLGWELTKAGYMCPKCLEAATAATEAHDG